MGWGLGNVGRETPVRRPTTQRPSHLSTFNGPQGGLGEVSLNTTLMRRAGAGPGLPGWAGPVGWGGASAALAGAHDHVGQLLHLGLAAHVVHDGQRLQRLRHAARRRRRSRVVLVVQGQDLRGGWAGSGSGVMGRVPPPHQPLPISLCLISFRFFLFLCLSPVSTLGLCLIVFLSPSIFLILCPPAFFSLIVSLRFSLSPSISLPLP